MHPIERLLTQPVSITKRDLDSATFKGFNYLTNGGFSISGKSVSGDSALGLDAVYHAVDLISSDYAALPQIVYKKTSKGREILEDHQVSYLLNFKPNFFQTPFEYKRMRAVHRLLFGESFVHIHRNEEGVIDNLTPIHPHNVLKVFLSDGMVWYSVKGFEKPIHYDDILHVKDLSATDGFRGESRVLNYCKEWTGRNTAINEYGSAYFGNGANPGLVFESVFETTEEDRKSLMNSLNADHRGSDKSHKAVILPQSLKLASGQMRFNQEQSQFIQTKIHSVEEAARIFNLPLNKMRTKIDSNSYGSQEQSNIEYVVDCLKPFVQGFQEEDNLKLFKAREIGKVMSRMALESRMKGDMKTQAEFIGKMLEKGVYNVNQALNYIGENSIGEAGEVRYIQSNQMILGQTPITEKTEDNGKKGN